MSRSGFYRWAASEPVRQARAAAEDALAEHIKVIHGDSGGAYGSPRVTVELRCQGVRVNRKRVERIMRQRDVVGWHLRRRKRTTVPDPAVPPVPDLIGRDFTADAADQRWCGDITYLRVGAGWLYLATVIDIATRRLIGWSINTHMRTSLVIDALDAAVAARGGRVDDVIFHSDRGAQYGSDAYADACRRRGVRRSMGRIGSSSTTSWPRRSSPPSSVNSTSTTDGGQPRPAPAATCSAGSPSTTTDAATPRWTTSAQPTTNRPSHPLRCTRSRHNPVSTSRGEPHAFVQQGIGHVLSPWPFAGLSLASRW